MNKRELTNQQRKKYSWQYIQVLIISATVLAPLIYGMGAMIIGFFQTNEWLFITLLITFTYIFWKMTQTLKQEIETIEERILKREQRNKRKGIQ